MATPPKVLPVSGKSFFIQFSPEAEQANLVVVNCRWEELKSPDHSMLVSGMHTCVHICDRGATFFYGVVHLRTQHKKEYAFKYSQKYFAPNGGGFDFDDLTYTPKLRMRWARPDPLRLIRSHSYSPLLCRNLHAPA